LPHANFASTVAFPFFYNLFIENGTQQGVYYSISGNTLNRTIIFEYYTTRLDKIQEYRFQVSFFEAKPNIVEFTYLNVSDDDVISALIGVQGKQLYQICILF
jgi:hypothetical protein